MLRAKATEIFMRPWFMPTDTGSHASFSLGATSSHVPTSDKPSEQKDAIRERNKKRKERQDQGLVSKPYNLTIHGTEEEQDLKLKLKAVCNKMGESLWKKPTYREVISRALSSWLKSHDDENDHRLAVLGLPFRTRNGFSTASHTHY
ncbi:hypothetical protein Bbelb_035850 [Branchiostoma belcheri]|nr:hypothetical protein Bbelb_035850 [Branchiostoma belcheri]